MPWTGLCFLGGILLTLNLAIGLRSSPFHPSQGDSPRSQELESSESVLTDFPERFPASHDELQLTHDSLTQKLHELRARYPQDRYPDGNADIVTVLMLLGEVRILQDQHGHACDWYQEALEMQVALLGGTELDGHLELATIHDRLSFAYFRNREFDKSGRHAQYALTVLRKVYDPEEYPNGHPDLAKGLWRYAFMRGGDQQAVDHYREALAIQKSHYPDGDTDTVITLMDLGNALTNLGHIDAAATYYAECVELLAQLDELETFQGATTTQYLGRHDLRLGRLDSAVENFREAVRIFETIYPAEAYPHGHDHLAHGLLELATALRYASQNEKAAEYAEKSEAMRLWRAANHVLSVSEAEALNYTSFQLDSPDLLLSAWPETERSVGSLYEYLWQRRGLIQRAQSNLLRKAMQSATPEVLEKYAEYRQLRDLLAKAAYMPAEKSVEARARRHDQLRTLTHRKEALERELARLLPDVQSDLTSSHGAPHTELTRFLPRDAAVLDFVRYRHIPALEEIGAEPHSTNAPDRYAVFVLTSQQPVQRIDLGSADTIDQLVDEWRGAIVDQPSVERMVATTLSEHLWRPLASSLPGDLKTIYVMPTGRLAEIPWAAIPGTEPGTTLLETLSFATLPHGHLLLSQLREECDADRPLPRLRHSSSDGGHAGQESQESHSRKGRLLAVGDVAFHPPSNSPDATDNSTVNANRAPEPLGFWNELPGTAAEMEVLREFSSRLETAFLTQHDATVQNVVTHLVQADFAHLATHGFYASPQSEVQQHYDLPDDPLDSKPVPFRSLFTSRNPSLLSGLVLAFPLVDRPPEMKFHGSGQPADHPNDFHPKGEVANGNNVPLASKMLPQQTGQIFTAEAIAALPLQDLKLVVLSACETGLGVDTDVEGFFGLQRAFHQAGARNVVTSLWKVQDDSTVALMRLFYENLWQRDLPPIEALRQAQLMIYRNPDLATLGLSSERGPRLVPGASPRRQESSEESSQNSPRSFRPRPELWAGFTLSGIGR